MDSTVTIGDDGYVRFGREARVNALTDNAQIEPRIAVLADGSYVIIWQSFITVDGVGSYEVRAQLYAADGTRIGQEFQVNTHSQSNQLEQEVTALANGGFVVTWTDQSTTGGDTSGWGIKAQIYAADGTPVGGEFLVNTTTGNNQGDPVIQALDGGGFMVVWEHNASGYGSLDVYGQIFADDGTPVGTELRIAAFIDAQYDAEIVQLADGNIVVVFDDRNRNGPDGNNNAVTAAIYAPDGSVVAAPFLVNTITTGSQQSSTITALADGGFVVTWLDSSATTDTTTPTVRAQIFEADGTTRGSEFIAHNSLASNEYNATIVALSGGGFAIVWQDNSAGVGDGDGSSVHAQIFAADGTEVGSQILVNTTTVSNQLNPQSVALDDGTFAVVWMDRSDQLVKAQVFAADGTKIGGEITVGDASFSFGHPLQLESIPGGGFVVSWTSNDNPIYSRTLGAGLQATEQVALDLKGEIVVDDADNPASVEVVLSVGYGVLDVTAGTSGATVSGSGTSQVTITGTLAQVQALLVSDGTSTVTYTADTDAPPSSAELSVTITDVSNAGAPVEATQTIGILQLDDAGTVEIGTPTADGGEQLVNQTAASLQGLSTIAATPDGGYIVSWSSQQIDGTFDVFARRFDADGTPLGNEFLVNTTTSSQQYRPSIAVMPNGDYVITWSSRDQDGSAWGVYTQRYDSSDNPLGTEIQVNQYISGNQDISVAVALEDGGYLIVWQSSGQDGSGNSVYARRYDSDGDATGNEFRVNTTTFLNQFLPAATALPDGGFVIAWLGYGDESSSSGIFVQQYAADGTTVGAEFVANTTTAGTQQVPGIAALSDGTYVIVWESSPQDGDSWGIVGRMFAADGTPLGGEFLVNTTTASEQQNATVRALPDGGFLVAWDSLDQDGSSEGVYGQRFDSDGNPIGTEFLINETTSGLQNMGQGGPDAFDVLADGSVVFTWDGAGTGDGEGVFSRAFDIPGLRATEQDPLDLKGTIRLDDPDNPDAVSVVIEVETGTLDVSAGTSGAIVSGSGTNSVTIFGTLAQVQALLESDPTSTITYTATDNATPSADDLTVTFTDVMSGGPEVVQSVTIGIDDTIAILGNSYIRTGSEQNLSANIFSELRLAPDAGFSFGNWQFSEFGELGNSVNATTLLTDGGYAFRQYRSSGGTQTYYIYVYDADRQIVSEFESDPLTSTSNIEIIGLPDGNIVVTWDTGTNVVARIHEPDGTPVTGVFTVGSTDRSSSGVKIAFTEDGGFIIAWDSFEDIGSSSLRSKVFARKFDAAGNPVTGVIAIDPDLTADHEYMRDIHALDNGNFVIEFARGPDTGLQLVAADGTLLGAEILVDPSSSLGVQLADLGNGRFAINWYESFYDSTLGMQVQNIFAQVIDADGTAGAPVEIDPAAIQLGPDTSITATIDGGFAVAWMTRIEEPEVSNHWDIVVQRFDASGNAISDPIVLSDATALNQSTPRILELENGQLAVFYRAQSGATVYRLLDQAIAATEQVDADLMGLISFSDADDPASVEVVISVADGVLDVTAGTSGAVVSGSGTGSVTITGSQAEVNALLNSDSTSSITYNADRDDPAATVELTVSFTDLTNGGATVTETESLQIVQVNDAVEDTDGVLESATTTTDVRFNDTDLDGLAYMAIDGLLVMLGDTVTLASGARVTLELDGTLTYDPNGAFDDLISAATAAATGGVNTSATDTYTYTLRGGDTTTVTVTIDGEDSAEDIIRGDSGSNTITGTPDSDLVDLSDGGSDTVALGDSNDAALYILGGWGGDTLDGGGGDQDQLGFQGNFGSLFLQNISNFEEIILFSGGLTRFGAPGTQDYSYSLFLTDVNVAAGGLLRISGNRLGANENFTLSGSSETDGSVLTFGGHGRENLTGTQQSDGFYFGGDRWGEFDRVNGANGDQDTLGLQGDYSAGVVFGSSQIFNIDIIALLSAVDQRFGGSELGGAFSYNLTMHDNNLAAGMEMAIAAARLGANEVLTFDGSAETDGWFQINSGEGDDVIIGSANGDTIRTQEGNDTITGGGGADTIRGGLGDDTFIYLDSSDSTAADQDLIEDFADGDVIDLSAIDAIAGGADDAFTFVGTDAFSNTAGELRVTNTSGNDWLIEADIDGDGVADLVIGVTRTDGLQFLPTDFIL